MADGISCKHCGHQESTHALKKDYGKDSGKKKQGYKKTLDECAGYTPENPILAEQLNKHAANEEARKSGYFGRPVD